MGTPSEAFQLPVPVPVPVPVPAQAERRAAAALVATALAIRVWEVFRYRFDSDEAQHLHVVWGWTQGLVQYRDLFDNHAPLFHLLCAPLLAALGETPRILFWMRLAMLPIFLLTLALTYRLGRALLSARGALWGTVLLALLPPFFYRTLEFRTDDLWVLLWLGVLVLLLTGAASPGRFLAAGLLLGAAFAVSLKTAPLAASLAVAAALVPLLTPPPGPLPARDRWRRAAALLAACTGGLLVVPLALVAFFATQGALAALVTPSIGHNLLAPPRGWSPLLRAALVIAAAAGLWRGGVWAARSHPPELRRRRLVLAGGTGLYLLTLWALWPIVAAQTYLPVEPVLALLAAHAAAAPLAAAAASPGNPANPTSRTKYQRAALPLAALLAAACCLLLAQGPLQWPRTRGQVAFLADALRLAGPRDPVMDLKGETIYRRRPFFYVLETITREAIERGLIPDTIPEAIAANGTCVAVADTPRLPARGRAFLNANFIAVGRLRVCGQLLAEPHGDPIRFDVRLPGRYVLATPAGPARGLLDGTPYGGSCWLAAGTHRLLPASPPPIVLLWAQAAERGFTPFAATPPSDGDR